MQGPPDRPRNFPRVLVAGGGTSAPVDDVRVITNLSTGGTAASIAEACLARGAEVWYLHTPGAALPLLRSARLDLDAANPRAELHRLAALRTRWQAVRGRLHFRPLRTGTVAEYAETLHGTLAETPMDVVFLPIAVSDYEPIPHEGKLSSALDRLAIETRPTPKVIRSVRDRAASAYLVGFKLLSGVPVEELTRRARDAGVANRADLTVANDAQDVRAGRQAFHLVRDGEPTVFLGPGPDLADRLVEQVLAWARERETH